MDEVVLVLLLPDMVTLAPAGMEAVAVAAAEGRRLVGMEAPRLARDDRTDVAVTATVVVAVVTEVCSVVLVVP